jgi:hypothetical protein
VKTIDQKHSNELIKFVSEPECQRMSMMNLSVAFENAGMEYPSIKEQLENADIFVISELNKKIRQRDINLKLN